MMPRLAALLLLAQLAASQMKFGKDEDDDKVHVSAMEVELDEGRVLIRLTPLCVVQKIAMNGSR